MAHGLAYSLTEYGQGLEEVVLALGRWGFQAMGDPGEDDIVTSDSMTIAFRTAYGADAASRFPETAYEVHIGDVALGLRTGVRRPPDRAARRQFRHPGPRGDRPSGRRCRTWPSRPARASARSSRESSAPREAIDSETVHIISGEAALLDRFAATFHLGAMAVEERATAPGTP